MEEGVCPICKKATLDYDGLEVEDNMVYYPWHCTSCHHEGKEWYNLTFTEHTINK